MGLSEETLSVHQYQRTIPSIGLKWISHQQIHYLSLHISEMKKKQKKLFAIDSFALFCVWGINLT